MKTFSRSDGVKRVLEFLKKGSDFIEEKSESEEGLGVVRETGIRGFLARRRRREDFCGKKNTRLRRDSGIRKSFAKRADVAQ